MEKLGQEPAFPPTREMQELTPTCEGYHVGMNRRFYAACAAMQGLLANDQIIIALSKIYPENSQFAELRQHTVSMAYEYADELLKQENE